MTLYNLRQKIQERMASFKGPVPQLITYHHCLDWVDTEIEQAEFRLAQLKKDKQSCEDSRYGNPLILESQIAELVLILGEKEFDISKTEMYQNQLSNL